MFHGPNADMVTVIDALLAKASIPSEQPLTPQVRRGLGSPTFRETVVAMLSRDPTARPQVPDLVQRWTGMMQHTTIWVEDNEGVATHSAMIHRASAFRCRLFPAS
jgi:hypothetical protein